MIHRIQTRAAFTRIRQEGVRLRSGPLSCTMVLDSSLPGPQVGYALGRSFGSAVSRNRLRRQLRELVKQEGATLTPGVYVFGASPRAAGLPSPVLRGHVRSLLGSMATKASAVRP